MDPRRVSRPRRRGLALVCGGLIVLASCGDSASEEAAARPEIEATLEAYLPRLAEAYATGEVEPLRGLAAEKEVAAVEKRIRDLALQGRTLEPVFRDLTVEGIEIWGYANAYVTTVETWDVTSHPLGREESLAREKGRRDRVRYQLKREGDRWLILARDRQE